MSRRAASLRLSGSPLHRSLLSITLTSLAALSPNLGCAPSLGTPECERDLECPDDRPVCTTGRCVARPAAPRADAQAPSLDAAPDPDRGTGGWPDAAPPTDLRGPEFDTPVVPPDAAPSTDARSPEADGRPVPADAAPVPGDLVVVLPDAPLVVDVGEAVPVDATPGGDTGPIALQDGRVPEADGPIAPPDAWTPPPDGFVAAPDAGCVPRPELCNGADDDCDGSTDEGLLRRVYQDADGDRWGTPNATVQTCEPALPGFVDVFGDCDDDDASVHPDAPEICNGEDDDCDGTPDDDAGDLYYQDRDGDGYGDPDWPTERHCTPPDGWVLEGGDCAPRSIEDHPGAEERCDDVDNDCDGAIDEPSIPGCEAPNADGTCSANDRFCVPVCRPGYSNPNVVLGDGCERGCTPLVTGLDLGLVPPTGARFGLARGDDAWAVAAVVPVPGARHEWRLVLFREASPPVTLTDGRAAYGHPAVVRTPTGWLVVTRITSEFPMPLRFDHASDAGQVTSVIVAAAAESDPAVTITSDPDDPIVFVAWIGPSAAGVSLSPYWTTLVGGDLRQIAVPQVLEGDFAAMSATPALALVENDPTIAFAALKGVEPKLVLRNVIPRVTPREAVDSLSTVPVRVRMVSRGGVALAGTTPQPGAAAEIHRFDLLGPALIPADAPLTLGSVPFERPSDVELLSTSTGFLLAYTAASAPAGPETRVYPLDTSVPGLGLIEAPIDLLAGDGRQLIVASDPTGTRHTGAWLTTSSAETVYAAGPLACQ